MAEASGERNAAPDRAIPLRLARTDLVWLMISATEIMKEQAASLDVDLRIDIEGNVPTDALVDPEKIAWAVTTLVGNALRHMGRGAHKRGGTIRVTLHGEPTRGRVVISVQDDGPGRRAKS